jgi:hypothetical protein
MRLVVACRSIALGVACLAALLAAPAHAQPGAVLGFSKLSSPSLAPLGLTLRDGDEFGDAVAWLGDLDGPGPSVAALAVGAIGDDDGSSHAGAVYILFLDGAGAVLSHQKISATQGGFTGTLESSDEFGSSVAWLGDLDGAGPAKAAIAVGTIGDDDGGTDHGAVYVLLLDASGQAISTQKVTSVQAGVPADATADAEEFGGSVAGLGDLDGAGPSAGAMAVGAIGDNDGGVNRGAVFIVYLDAAGAFLSSAKISDTAGNFTAVLENNDGIGEDVADLGDFDGVGPGVRSLAVTSVEDNDGGTASGAVYLLHLNANGTVNSWSKISRTSGGLTAPITNYDNFGTAVVALGDLDGTGPSHRAIAVSAGSDDGLGFNRGAVYVLFLNSSGSVLSHQEISSTAGGSIGGQFDDDDEFGSALTALGDIDGSGGAGQVLVSGVGYDDDGGLERGATYLVSLVGGTTGPSAPVVTAPATASGPENALLTVNVTAVDPDGDAITSFIASGLPAGASFTPNGTNTSGTLSWTPTFSQSGVHIVTFTASNALSGSSSTQITITNVDRAPVVTAPAAASGPENALLTVNVTAADPDGQSITSLTATGLPTGATFTPNGSRTAGTLEWTPTFSQSGVHNVTFTATNALSGSSSTQITITDLDRPPVVGAPPSAGVAEGTLLTIHVTATDADGQAIASLTATDLPPGATFTPDAGNASGTLEWTPAFGQSGVHTVTFTASNTLAGLATTEITVSNVDRAPVVIAPASAPAWEGLPFSLEVRAADPDGEPITSFTATGLPAGATFTPGPGDSTGRLQWTPAVGQAGDHTLTFTASNALSGSSSTQVTVTVPSTGVGPSEATLLRPTLVPSPLRTRSTLSFRTTEPGPVEVDLIDLTGRRVRRLLSVTDAAAGVHQLVIDGHGDRGERLPSGVYQYRIRAARRVWTGRLVVTR